jgi:predicted RNA-binding Zn ribbon-like protein
MRSSRRRLNGSSIIAARRRSGTPGVRLAAWLAEAAAELLADPGVTKVRECEAEDCVMLFLPAHPRRRWCSATRCGNRARVARHYQRHRPA